MGGEGLIFLPSLFPLDPTELLSSKIFLCSLQFSLVAVCQRKGFSSVPHPHSNARDPLRLPPSLLPAISPPRLHVWRVSAVRPVRCICRVRSGGGGGGTREYSPPPRRPAGQGLPGIPFFMAHIIMPDRVWSWRSLRQLGRTAL